MNYPIYDIPREHRFSEIQKNLVEIKNLRGPVYDIDHMNSFYEVEKLVHDLKSLTGPVYHIDGQHKFNEVEKKITELKNLQGPVYDGIDREHQYFGNIESSLSTIRNVMKLEIEILGHQHFIFWSFANCKTSNYKVSKSLKFNFFDVKLLVSCLPLET